MKHYNKIKILVIIIFLLMFLKAQAYPLDHEIPQSELLERIVWLEARGESEACQTNVAITILNRVESKKFPNNIEKVIFQKGQFQPSNYVKGAKIPPSERKRIGEAISVAYRAMEYADDKPLYFMNPDLAEKSSCNWFRNELKFMYKIDKTEFYK